MTSPQRPRKRGSRAETPVTQEAIVDAAFKLIEDRGGQAFSMRALATEMGVFPATLYWHVGDRARLLGMVEERWLGGIEAPPADLDWRTWMVEVAHRYRTHAHQHPNVARLVMVERARNVESMALPDLVVGKLADLGLGDDLGHAYNALVGAVQGFVVLELALIAEPEADSTKAAEAEIRALDPDRFPNITRHFDLLADKALSVRWSDGASAPLDASFDYLLDLLLSSLETRLPTTTKKRHSS